MDVASLILLRLPDGTTSAAISSLPQSLHVSAECRLADIQCTINNDLNSFVVFPLERVLAVLPQNVTANVILHVQDCFGPWQSLLLNLCVLPSKRDLVLDCGRIEGGPK